MKIFCQQRITILMKYHTLFVIFEKAAKFEIVVFCKLPAKKQKQCLAQIHNAVTRPAVSIDLATVRSAV